MICRCRYAFFILCLLGAIHSVLQGQASIDSMRIVQDSMSVYVRSIESIDAATAYKDTTLGSYFYGVDKATGRAYEYEHLGNAGSSARPMLEDVPLTVGYHRGYNQYDLYRYTPQSYRIFSCDRAFSHASFSPLGGIDKDFIVDAKFAQRFKGDIGVSLMYDRIVQEGFYKDQATKMSNFGVSLFHLPTSKRYRSVLTILSNVAEENHSGGVEPDTDFLVASSQTRRYISTMLSGAASRYQEKTIDLRQDYRLSSNIKAYHTLQYQWMYYKYGDPDVGTTNDSIAYKSYRTDERGLRLYYRDRTIANTLGLAYEYGRVMGNLGLSYDYVKADNEHTFINYHGLQGKGQARWKVHQSVDVYGKGALGMIDGAGTYDLDVGARLRSSWVQGDVSYRLGSRQASFVEKYMSVSGVPVYKNEFKNTDHRTISASLKIPLVGLKLGYQRSTMDHVIYYDSLAMPQQLETGYTVDKLTASWKAEWRGLATSHHAFLQRFSSNVYHLPTYYQKSALSYSGYLFDRALWGQIGVVGTYIPSRAMPSYMPLAGRYIQSAHTSQDRKKIDVYLAGKVQTFRVFVSAENLLSYFDRQPIIHVYNHPMFDANIRFGISWLFRN